MDEFQIYTVESKVFGDPTPNKRRPSVYVGLSSEKFGYIRLLGVYTYKEKFGREDFSKKMYKIQDKDVARISSQKDSYIDVSTEILVSLVKIRDLAEPKPIGKLSDRDICGLIAKYNQYQSTFPENN